MLIYLAILAQLSKPKKIDNMLGIKQQDGELNGKYVKQFCQAVAVIKDLDDNIVVKTFTRGMSQSEQRFYNYITWHNPPIKAYLFDRCEKHVEKEDDYKELYKKDNPLKTVKVQELRHDRN